jgi:manganese transport protein
LQPELDKVLFGLIPSMPNEAALYIAIGIIGYGYATQFILAFLFGANQKIERTTAEIKQALKYNFIDSTIALNLAFLVNAAILIWLQPHFIETECLKWPRFRMHIVF